jgi:hypothetical protein
LLRKRARYQLDSKLFVCVYSRRPKISAHEIQISQVLRNFVHDLFQIDVPAEISALIAALAENSLDWDRTSFSDYFVTAEENSSILVMLSRNLWHIAVAEMIFERGSKYSFSVRVSLRESLLELGDKSSFYSFGVVPVSSDVISAAPLMTGWPQVGGWEWWTSRGVIRHEGKKKRYAKRLLPLDSVVTIRVDFTKETMSATGKGTLAFSCNDDHYAVAYDNVVPPIKPAVSVFLRGSSVEITGISQD